MQDNTNVVSGTKKTSMFLLGGSLAVTLLGYVAYRGLNMDNPETLGVSVSPGVTDVSQSIVVDGGMFYPPSRNTESVSSRLKAKNVSLRRDLAPDEAWGKDTPTVRSWELYFEPNEIKVKAGEKVSITFKNIEGVHDFVIDEFDIKTNRINVGENETIEFVPQNPGTYEFYCSVGNHRAMGMKGNLIVE